MRIIGFCSESFFEYLDFLYLCMPHRICEVWWHQLRPGPAHTFLGGIFLSQLCVTSASPVSTAPHSPTSMMMLTCGWITYFSMYACIIDVLHSAGRFQADSQSESRQCRRKGKIGQDMLVIVYAIILQTLDDERKGKIG